MTWFKTGLEAKKALEQAEIASQLLKEKAVPRFWLKPNEEAQIIFVDDEGFWCERHIVKLGNKFVEFTCKSGAEPCPLCLKEDRRPAGFTYFTIIDLRQYERKDGTVVKYTKALLPARRTLAKQLFDFKQKFGSLVGLRAILKRYTSQDPSCGIIVDFVRDAKGQPKKYNLGSLGKEYTVPFDYIKVLAPPTEEELKAFGYTVAVIGDALIPEDVEEIEEELTDEVEEPTVEETVEEEVGDEELLDGDLAFDDEVTDEEIEEEFDEVSFDDFIDEEIEEEEPKPKKKEEKKDTKKKKK